MNTCWLCSTAGPTVDGPLVAVFDDGYPVAPGHKLIVPRRHVESPFDLTDREAAAVWSALHAQRATLLATDPTIVGFNVGFNAGSAAGQTVLHAHVHLIPRRFGDTPNPQGGIRGAIPCPALTTSRRNTASTPSGPR